MPLSLYLIWFLLGIGFIVAEMVVPGFILVFFAAGSWIVATTVYFLPDLELTIQIIIFMIASLALLFTLRRYGLKTFKGDSKGGVDDEFSKIGRNAVVSEAIDQNGYGEIQLDGTFWRATANVSIEKDQRVIVEGQESSNGLILKVKPSSTGPEKKS